MRRKVLSLLLFGIMVCSMLTACGGSERSNETVEKVSEEDDSSRQGKNSATILDSVKYVPNDDEHEMMESAKAYLDNKGITYQDDGAGMVSTLSDDFLGYRAYYGWDYDDYSIYLTFDSEDDLKQAVADVREYLSSRSDSDFEGTDFCKAVEEKGSKWGAVLDWYENGEVFCTDYSQDDEEIYIEATSFNVNGGLSRIRTENEAEYILGDCDSFIEIMVAGKAFDVNTDFGSMSDDGKFAEAAAASDAPQSTSSGDAEATDTSSISYTTEDGFSTDCWQTVDNTMYKLDGDTLMIGEQSYLGITLEEAREIHQLQRNIVHTNSNHEEFEAKSVFMRRCKEIAENHKSDTGAASDASQSTSSENHDYMVSVANLYSFNLEEDNHFKLTATCNLYDDYTRDPANSPDSIYYEVSDECELVYYGKNIADVKEFFSKLSEEYSELYEKMSNNLDIGDEIDLRVVIESGKIISMEIGYAYDLAN